MVVVVINVIHLHLFVADSTNPMLTFQQLLYLLWGTVVHPQPYVGFGFSRVILFPSLEVCIYSLLVLFIVTRSAHRFGVVNVIRMALRS
jgi:hypothetical protein